MRTYLELGPAPYEEEAAQVGTEDYKREALKQARKYIDLLEKKFGTPPEGAYYKIKSFPHDFGDYYEVVLNYDDENPEHIDYAYTVESNLPARWSDTQPVLIVRREPFSKYIERIEESFPLAGGALTFALGYNTPNNKFVPIFRKYDYTPFKEDVINTFNLYGGIRPLETILYDRDFEDLSKRLSPIEEDLRDLVSRYSSQENI